jgi:Protein of unknown function (DUF1549)/Protein of unknown function (DUF1553)
MHLSRRRPLLAATVCLGIVGGLHAGDLYKEKDRTDTPIAPLPGPADVLKLEVHPDAIAFRGADDSTQLVLTGSVAGGKLVDLTSDVKYEIDDPKVARITSTGRVVPLGNGRTTVTASYGDKVVHLPVSAAQCDVNLPINFTNQIVPVFTKLGCNAGGCHGKASGQNGFKLSLLGFEPQVDYNALVKEDRGRRIFPAAPDHSLLLEKASGIIAHGGGKRMDPASDEYRLVRRWVAAGVPFGEKTDPVVSHISVFPEHRILSRQGKQQFAVYAHYSDGSVEDITRRAQYESNDQEVAVVDGAALVRTLSMSGEAAIMVRYQEHVATFRASVPLGTPTPDWSFPPQSLADGHAAKKWRELGLVPSELCTDGQFLRRISLDLTGSLPTPAKVLAFTADTDPGKRDKLIEELLASPDYSDYFANKWADLLRVKRHGDAERARGTFAFHDWIRNAVATDMPYDEFARAILAATGDEVSSPPTVWCKELRNPEQFVDDTAQVFLGLRLACAQCHHHPYERWSQDDFWGIAAFFGRVGRKAVIAPDELEPGRQGTRQIIYPRSSGSVTNKKTNQPAIMRPLDGAPVNPASDQDPRQLLVDWMVEAKNPFFARAVVNRYWAHFFGRGIVDPPDDMRVTNPPSNPELLDALAKDLIEHRFSLKNLVRAIVKSRTYQLSSVPNDFNSRDKQNFARYYPRRMSAEVLYDAVNLVADSPAGFGSCRRTDTRRAGRFNCPTSRSRRISWTYSADRNESVPANANASVRPTWPRRCICSTATRFRASSHVLAAARTYWPRTSVRKRTRSTNCSSGHSPANRR